MKNPTSLRISELTKRQISDLQKATGMNQTEIVSIAIDRMARKETEMSKAYDNAEDRVVHDPRLAKYADTILYEWFEGDDHWKWVAKAPAQEIIDWAESVEKE